MLHVLNFNWSDQVFVIQIESLRIRNTCYLRCCVIELELALKSVSYVKMILAYEIRRECSKAVLSNVLMYSGTIH
jgi:hypothetical protein